MNPVTVAITCGDPSGVGLELVLRALAAHPLAARIVLLASAPHLERAMEAARRAVPPAAPPRLRRVGGPEDLAGASAIGWFPLSAPRGEAPVGRYDPAWGRVAAAALDVAASWALQGRVDAIVTAPITKRILVEAGWDVPGQTEYFAERAGVRRPVMMMASPSLRVSLATTHLPLARVSEAIDPDGLADVLATTHDALRRDFGVAAPRLAVCGLNPHAGEGGRFGDEEARVVAPAVEHARSMGIDVRGPVAADTWFALGARDVDATVALYHDQGLIPVKLLHFDETVNVTLGLPFVRTSPDHGVAWDLAGTGRARAGSTRAAIELAVRCARRRAES